MALADIEGAQIHLKQVILSHQLASWESVQEILVEHYTRQFLHEMYKVNFGTPLTVFPVVNYLTSAPPSVDG